MNKITTILQTYRRPHLLEKQINAIRSQSVGDTEIIVVHNESDESNLFRFPKDVEVIRSSKNFKYHLRFAIATLIKTEYICIFDDDTIPGIKWYENCLKHIYKEDGLYGTLGIILKDNSYLNKERVGWSNPNLSIKEVDLVGHSWFARQANLKYLWYEDPISLDNGEDIQLSYLLQKYTGLKTFVPPHPIENKELWGSIEGHNGEQNASFNSQPGGVTSWYKERDEIVKKCIAKGWRTVETREGSI